MTFSFLRNVLQEGRPHVLSIDDLPYEKKELDPALSEDTLNYHFEKLAKTYADRYNKGEGDAEFNEAGVFLHNILFQQYKPFSSANKPTGRILELIESNFKSFDNFKEEFFKTAMSIQGSGWVYLSKDAKIKTIANHRIKQDILILVDWWEHAWALDYQSDKKKYLENQWKIIDWEKINGLLRQSY